MAKESLHPILISRKTAERCVNAFQYRIEKIDEDNHSTDHPIGKILLEGKANDQIAQAELDQALEQSDPTRHTPNPGERPSGFIATCRSTGKTVAAIDSTRINADQVGKILGQWLYLSGHIITPQYGEWSTTIEPTHGK